MKNKFLIALLAFMAQVDIVAEISCKSSISIGHDDQCVCKVEHMHTESLMSEVDFRKRLYWFDQHNPAYFKLRSFQKDLDYYITIIKDHIMLLEKKCLLGHDEVRKHALCSRAMFSGLFASMVSSLAAYGAYANYTHNGINAKNAEWAIGSVMFGLTSAFVGHLAKEQFVKVYRYAEHIVERLERDRRILAILEREKAAKDAEKTNKFV